MTVLDQPGPSGSGFLSKVGQWWGPRPLTQILVILAFVLMLVWLGANTAQSLTAAGIKPGFAFLGRSANFQIGEIPIPYSPGDTYARAILVGLVNTIRAVLIGCVLATVLGVLLGVALLSRNMLLVGLVRAYVEVIRNTPLLLQLFFWAAVTHAFPQPRQAISAFGAVFLSNRGIFVPGIILEGAGLATAIAACTILLVGTAAFIGMGRVERRPRGARAGVAAVVILTLLVIPLLTGASVGIELPRLSGFNIRGGWSLTPEFGALVIGLVVKFSASIAEIVRAGIQSVGASQWEAARSLGLGPGQIMRLVVLPQALRVITPLMTSSYLDLTKDSSLAVAIGYPDLVNVVNTTANQTGQALEALAILVAIYLSLNLGVSALMNRYNRRVALRGTAR